jgi:hypothetical protein
MGIEPTYAAWEAAVLPLNYTRTATVIPAGYQVWKRPFARRLNSLELNIVLAHRTKDVQDFAIGDGAAGMHRMGRNDAYRTRPKHLADAIHDNFEFSFKRVRDLFMGMGMLGQLGAGRNVPVDEGHACRSDEFSPPSRKRRLFRKIVKIGRGHRGAGLSNTGTGVPFLYQSRNIAPVPAFPKGLRYKARATS